MIKDVAVVKELVLDAVNKIGILAEISRILSGLGISIDAISGYTTDPGKAKITLVTSDNLRAGSALKKGGYLSLYENSVIIVSLENKTGALELITSRLAREEIDIKYIYGTTCPGEAPARVVLSTDDNENALAALRM